MALTRGFTQNSGTTPLDTRLMFMALLKRNSDGSPRLGMLYGPATPVTGTTSMNVTLADNTSFVLSRGTTDGVTIINNVGGTVSVTLDAAPSANARIDVVWLKQNDGGTGGQGDADSLPTLGKTSGTAAASPAVPAIPTGALALAQVYVPANVASTTDSGVAITTIVGDVAVADAPALLTSGTAANWDSNGSSPKTVHTVTFTTTRATNVELDYEVTIDSGGAQIGGSIGLYLNGTLIGRSERITTPGSVRGSWVHTLRKPARAAVGTNTFTVVVTRESSTATIFGNSPTYEVWTR